VKNCIKCEEPFLPLGNSGRYCGEACRVKAAIERSLEEIPAICSECDCEFMVQRKSTYNVRWARLCPNCRIKRNMNLKAGDWSFHRHCIQCGDEFFTKQPRQTYCNTGCRYQALLLANAARKKVSQTRAPQTPKVAIAQKVKCATCAFGIASEISSIGWECKANALRCKPLHQAVLYQRRAVASGK
jgi:hypothetical protein